MIDETCSMCGVPINDVSVFRSSTLCSKCRRQQAAEEAVPLRMPASTPGTWYESSPDGFRLGAGTRSWKGYVTLACGALVLGVFFRVGRPSDPLMILFLAGAALATRWKAAMTLFGAVSLIREGSTFAVFTGIGAIGRKRVYDWADLTSVHERPTQSGESVGHEIVIVGGQRVAFGSELTDERRYFLREVLRIELTRGR
jgi:hypothetical protein